MSMQCITVMQCKQAGQRGHGIVTLSFMLNSEVFISKNQGRGDQVNSESKLGRKSFLQPLGVKGFSDVRFLRGALGAGRAPAPLPKQIHIKYYTASYPGPCKCSWGSLDENATLYLLLNLNIKYASICSPGVWLYPKKETKTPRVMD